MNTVASIPMLITARLLAKKKISRKNMNINGLKSWITVFSITTIGVRVE